MCVHCPSTHSLNEIQRAMYGHFTPEPVEMEGAFYFFPILARDLAFLWDPIGLVSHAAHLSLDTSTDRQRALNTDCVILHRCIAIIRH